MTRHFAALSVIEQAVEQSCDRDVRSQELIDAIKTLLPHANVRWPFEQLWRGLASERVEDRAIIANASFNAILVSLNIDPFTYQA